MKLKVGVMKWVGDGEGCGDGLGEVLYEGLMEELVNEKGDFVKGGG